MNCKILEIAKFANLLIAGLEGRLERDRADARPAAEFVEGEVDLRFRSLIRGLPAEILPCFPRK